MKCAFCDEEATTEVGGPTPAQSEMFRKWVEWVRNISLNPGHPPIESLSLPPIHVCKSCRVIYEVMKE